MPVPIIHPDQMREWEAATWSAGQIEAEVIRRVGRKIAERAAQLTRPGEHILILAGKGNNGADARAAQPFLSGRKLEVFPAADGLTELPQLQSWLRQKPALIIDGWFGIGLNRPLDDGWKKLIATVNDSKVPVLAVDVPSGLNAATGEHFGAAIEAAITLSVGAPKTGLLAQSAWPFVGRLEVLTDVGLANCPHRSDLNWTLPEDFKHFPPRRPVAGNKGTFGHVAVVAGSLGFHGAGVLAASAAQRAQPGLVTLFTQENVYHAAAAQLRAAMVKLWRPEMNLLDGASAILVGPGLAAPDVPEEMKNILRRLWRDARLPLVVDASALEWLSPYLLMKNLIRVITPHPGEAARLLNSTAEKVQADRPRALRELSKRFGDCWVVLKGHQTLVGRSTGEMFVNPSGNPHLAQGGSGDVLAGFIAGLLAQPALQTDVATTLRFAVWEHGAAADALQAARPNWVVEDLLERIGGNSASSPAILPTSPAET